MNKIKNLSKKYRILILILCLIIFTCFIVCLPSLGKFKNRNTVYTMSSWDGSIATNYQKGDGTKENPFIISNGSEFAFFIEQLKSTDYKDTYFELSNDVVINSGVFDYNETDGLKYIFEDITYYVKENTTEYYTNKEMNNNYAGKLNDISMIKNFKGFLNGNSFTLFGLYINDSVNSNLALFENLEGKINDLYITNSVVAGKGYVAGLAVNSKNSTIENVIYDGYIINKNDYKNIENSIEEIKIESSTVSNSTILSLPQVEVDGVIKSIKLTGEYSSVNAEAINTILINNVDISNASNFEINLGTSILNEVSIVTTSNIENTEINFSNLKYIIEYSDDISSGIIANSNNTNLKNVINKADVYGNYISSGIIGKESNKLIINQSYNSGNIKSNYISSGIIGVIKDNNSEIVITNVYNKGIITSQISSGLISIIKNNTGQIQISNSINTSNNYFINTIEKSNVIVDNSYILNTLSIYNGEITGAILQTTPEILYSQDFLKTLSYKEYVDYNEIESDPTKVWIYEKNLLPILYIDDLSNPIANLTINKYNWTNLSSELDVIDITKKFIFSINDVSVINPIQKYYYITNSKVPLTEVELNNITWTEYTEPVEIQDSGYYVIYVKTVDLDNDIKYINSDIIKYNKNGFVSEINMNDYSWNIFKTELENIYVNRPLNLIINAHDDLVTINSIEYYVSNEALTEDEIKNVTNWNIYSNNLVINETGKYIIYVKIVDSDLKTTYINTDYILYGGYKETLSLENYNGEETNYITDKSTLKLTFENDFEIVYKEGYSHNLISNILLPLGTKVTLIDKYDNKIYQKIIDTEQDLYGYNTSCEGKLNCSKYATYNFSSFKEIGTTKEKYYDESKYIDKAIKTEKYIIKIDFSNTNLIENYYDLMFYLAIKNESNKYLYQTLDNTINKVNVYTSVNNEDITTKHELISDYSNQNIYYNNDSEISINFTNKLTHTSINDKLIIDTIFGNKKAGLLIKLYSEDNNILDKKYLDNMIFEVGGKEFFADEENSIKVNLGRVSSDEIKTLKIKTKPNSSGLKNGIYYITINKFISDDGYYYDSLYEDGIKIPLIVDNQVQQKPEHSFDVIMDNSSVMIDKKLENKKVNFNIICSGINNPIIKVSMSQKKNEGSKDQEYSLVDIKNYLSSSTNLQIAETNKYIVNPVNSMFELEILPKKFDYNGYKYIFELYDGTTKIGKIEKYFIVR